MKYFPSFGWWYWNCNNILIECRGNRIIVERLIELDEIVVMLMHLDGSVSCLDSITNSMLVGNKSRTFRTKLPARIRIENDGIDCDGIKIRDLEFYLFSIISDYFTDSEITLSTSSWNGYGLCGLHLRTRNPIFSYIHPWISIWVFNWSVFWGIKNRIYSGRRCARHLRLTPTLN